MRAPALALALLALLSAACGDDGVTPPDVVDGSVDRDTGPPWDGVIELPQLTPCPEGWTEVELNDEVTVCEPWPDTGYDGACAPDEGHFVGEAGCAQIGTPCTDDRWASDLPTDATIIYVDNAAMLGRRDIPDGTRSLPFPTIGEAMSMAAAGDVVAVSKGTYDEVVRLRRGVTLWGACVAETSIASSMPRSDSEIFTGGTLSAALSPDVTIRNLRVGGERIGIWNFAAFADGDTTYMTIRDVVIDGTVEAGILGSGPADFTIENVVIQNVRRRATNERGFGLSLENAAVADLDRVIIEDSAAVGLVAFPNDVDDRPKPVIMDRLLVRGTRSVDESTGLGIYLDGADFDGSRIVVEENDGPGLIATGMSTGRITHGVMRSNTAGRTGQYGYGVLGAGGAVFTVSGSWMHDDALSAVVAIGAGTRIELEDSVASGTRSRADGIFGRAVTSQEEATVVASRFYAYQTSEMAITATLGAHFEATDFVIREVAPRDCAATTCTAAPFGIGLGIFRDSSAILREFAIRDAELAGIQLAEEGAELDLYDGTVTGCPIGVNIQIDDYDVGRLSNGVSYEDNGTNLDAMSLPVPEPVTTVMELEE